MVRSGRYDIDYENFDFYLFTYVTYEDDNNWSGHSEIKTYSIEYCAIVLGVCNILGVASTQGVKLLAIMGELSKL